MNKLQLPFMRDLHNTLVNITNEHMGSQSVLFEGTVVHVYDYKGAVVFGNISINFPERFVDVAFIC